MPSTYRKGDLTPYPDGFTTKNVETNGATIHTRVGGRGVAVVRLHGYGVTADSWAPLATTLADTHTDFGREHLYDAEGTYRELCLDTPHYQQR